MGGAWGVWASDFSGRAGEVRVNNRTRASRKSFPQRHRGRVLCHFHSMNLLVDTLHVSRKDLTLAPLTGEQSSAMREMPSYTIGSGRG
jgi:hypothetical protein